MLRACLLLSTGVLLAGCLTYKLRIRTVVSEDGRLRRTISIRCGDTESPGPLDGHEPDEDSGRTWSRFEPPRAPFGVTGSHAKGFFAQADFEPGVHGGGIRLRLEEDGDEVVEGKVRLSVSDLIVGRLYRYRENLAIGADSARFRRELPERLDLWARFFVETLRIKMPQADLDPVVRNARERLVPRIESSILLVRRNIDLLIRDYRARAGPVPFEEWSELVHHPSIEVLLQEAARYGVVRAKGREKPTSPEDLFDGGAWELKPIFLRELLAPMRGVTEAERDELIRSMLDGSIELDEDAAMESLYPDEEQREALEDEMTRFAVTAVGAYHVSGLFDDHEFSFRLTMPGRLLATNGELGSQPELHWLLTDPALLISDPEMTAASFLPAPGMPAGGWRLKPLLELERWLAEAPGGMRARLKELAALGLEKGWPEAMGQVDEEQEDGLHGALTLLREAVEVALGETAPEEEASGEAEDG